MPRLGATTLRGLEGYGYVAPSVIVLAAGLFIPLALSFLYAMYDWNYLRPQSREWVGLSNFIGLLCDEATLRSLSLTVLYTAIAVSVEMVLGVAIAVLVNGVQRMRNLIRALILLPMLVSPVVAALAWKLLYAADYGLLNHLLGLFGATPVVWLGADHAFWSVVAVEVWQNTPFVVLIALAALQAVPSSLVEAAALDGAGGLQTFKAVVFPLISPVLAIALIFRTTFALREFTLPWVLTQGGPADSTLVLGIRIYREAFRYFSMGSAAAMSWTLLLLTLLVSIVFMRYVGRSEV